MTWEDKVKRYDAIVAHCGRIQRKGKTMPYTSANGHMFSLLNKEGALGFRYSPEVQQKYMKEWDSGILTSHGATMRGYVQIPEKMFGNLLRLAGLLEESHQYVLTLPPGKKK